MSTTAPQQTAAIRDVGRRLVDLCRQGKHLEAIDTLYSPDIVSREVCGDEQMPAEMTGLDAIRGKNRWWLENHEVHRSEARGPFPRGDRFAVYFQYDITPKIGPGANQRVTFEEIALYTVKDGKIVEEEFFYDMG